MNDNKERSRSEFVRLRREQERERQLKRAVSEVAHPVVARARQEPSPAKRKVVKNARRRFQVALPLPRQDMRAVNIPRLQFNWRLPSLVMVALFITALYLAFNLTALRVTEAQLIGNSLLAPAEVNSVMGIAGQPIFLINPADLETRLRLNYPELVSIKVDVSLPNLVTVNVTERQPVIRWEQGGGYTWIAEDGVAFRPRGEMQGLIPVVALTSPPAAGSAVDSLTPAQFISTEMVRALKGLVSHAPQGAPILYAADSGFGWNDPRGWRVYFGTGADDIELKMRVYEAMVGSLTQRGIRPALINVVYPTAPYYRMTE
jgi:hypothetical protein